LLPLFLDQELVTLLDLGVEYSITVDLEVRIPMMPISQSDLMPISSERSDAGLPQSELVIGIRQDFSRVGLVFH